jgi:hypothetical protein
MVEHGTNNSGNILSLRSSRGLLSKPHRSTEVDSLKEDIETNKTLPKRGLG